MRTVFVAAALAAVLAGAGCTVAEERAGGGAVLGAATGSILGALATGRPGGALAGAALGGATGAIVGAATTPAYGPPPPVLVRRPPVVVEEEILPPPPCRIRVERIYDPWGGVTIRRTRTCF